MNTPSASGLFRPSPFPSGPHEEGQASSFEDATVVSDEFVEPLNPVEADGAQGTPVAPAPKRGFGGIFQRNSAPKAGKGVKAPKTPKGDKPGKVEKAKKAPAFQQLPIQVVMGYLPEVAKRDAIEYAIGMVDKYVDQVGLAHYTATPYDGGFIYEVHEGGAGKAYGPEIAKYFMSAGPFKADEAQRVVLRTARRMVEVSRERQGLSVVLLAESATDEPTEWLVPKGSMISAVPRRKGMLIAGLVLFVSGLLAAGTSAVFFRLQGYSTPPDQPTSVVSTHLFPHKQWSVLERFGAPVKVLRYENGAWSPPQPYTPEDLEPKAAPAEPGDAAASSESAAVAAPVPAPAPATPATPGASK